MRYDYLVEIITFDLSHTGFLDHQNLSDSRYKWLKQFRICITLPKLETKLFVPSKLIVHRRFMMFEFAATGCLLAAASEFEAWDLF